jgi:hypothetical protein
LAGAALVGLAGSANAAAIIEVEFQLSGTPTVTVAPSATVTADIFLDLTGEPLGSQGFAFTIEWDSAGQNNLDFLFATELGAAGDVPAGPWAIHITPGVTPVLVESALGTPGQHGSFSAANLFPVGSGGGLRTLVGTITFHARAPFPSSTNVTPIFRLGEQVNSDDGLDPPIPTLLLGGVVNVVPEPMTAALMAMGLLGLGIAGRRRQ